MTKSKCNMQKAMTGGSKSKTGYQPIILYLSRQLSEFRYGYEYGALNVKSHLERVIFSDIVLTVTIKLVHFIDTSCHFLWFLSFILLLFVSCLM